MGITNRDLEQAYAQHKEQYGGQKEDYFAEFDKIADQVAPFGKDVAARWNANT